MLLYPRSIIFDAVFITGTQRGCRVDTSPKPGIDDQKLAARHFGHRHTRLILRKRQFSAHWSTVQGGEYRGPLEGAEKVD
jgi:hypothetical protein